MAMQLRYKGAFVAVDGTEWECRIFQEAEAPYSSVEELTFEADEPLVIEWKETAKHDVICGSMATVSIESPGDRTYQDLYTIKPGTIRLDVYRAGSLYWSGLLDPEFYEEPYERAALYPVQLTFSDFGILDRLKYRLTGMQTLLSVLENALSESGINTGGIDQTGISTMFTDGTKADLAQMQVRSDNFVDEDGEQSTLKEAVEGILQPLGLRLEQKAGKVYVYDINGLYGLKNGRIIRWNGDSQTMGVDRVYNNARITWSTYSQAGNMLPDEAWTQTTDSRITELNNLDGGQWGQCRVYSYHYGNDVKQWAQAMPTDSGFSLWVSGQGQGATLDDGSVSFFTTVPQIDGSKDEGMAIGYTAFRAYSAPEYSMEWRHGGVNPAQLAGTPYNAGRKLYTTAGVWIPRLEDEQAERMVLRLSLDMLFDVRPNFYEEAVDMGPVTGKQWQDFMNRTANFVYVPVLLRFKADADGREYVWDNRAIVLAPVSNPETVVARPNYGTWKPYTEDGSGNPSVFGYLAWYDPDDRFNRSAIANGWRKNRHAVNPHRYDMSLSLRKAEDGQYIRYPSVGSGGRLSVTVLGRGWMIARAGDTIDKKEVNNPDKVWGWQLDQGANHDIFWVLQKLPELEILNDSRFASAIDTDDVEYSASLNADAKEELEMECVCGSSGKALPTARGAYFRTSDGKQITEMQRAGRVTQLENLLIGTLYSQYAERKVKLSGEAEMDGGGLCAYTEQNQEGKKFMMLSKVEDTRMATAEMTVCELRPDEYEEN